MSSEQTKKNINTLRQIMKELFEKGNLDSYEQLVDKAVVVHCPKSWQDIHSHEVHGRNNAKEIDKEYAKAFQHKEVNIDDIFAHEDKVVVRWTCTGTQTDVFFSRPAKNQTFSISGQGIYRFTAEGKVIEVWQSWDMLGLLHQIGALQINQA